MWGIGALDNSFGEKGTALSKIRKEAAPDAAQETPLTISRPELLVDGSDREFRRLVHLLFGFMARHEAVRAGHASRIGLAGVEYSVLISIAHLNAHEGSVTVNRLANHLYLSGAFITTITNKLEKKGLVIKESDTADRRRVLLRVTRAGRQRLDELAPVQRQVNDVEFGALSNSEFLLLIEIMEKLIESSESAIKLQRYLADH